MDNPVLKAVLGAIGTFAAVVTAIYVFGGVVLLLRLQFEGLRGEVVVSSLPREYLISVGLALLLQFLVYVLILFAAYVQQRVPEVRARMPVPDSGNPAPALAVVIRVAIVGGATVALALPLTRWIGWSGVPLWWAPVVAWASLLASCALILFDDTIERNAEGKSKQSALDRERGLRWAVALGVIGLVGVAAGIVSIFTFSTPLVLLGLALAAVVTAICLWFLLKRLVDQRTTFDRGTIWRGALLMLLAFLIFVPWRVALEASSVKGLTIRVCTSTGQVDGLYVGENDNTVLVGVTDPSPRIEGIPRDEITRSFLGTQAQETPCAPSLSSLTLSPTSVQGGNPSTGAIALSGAAPKGGVVIALSSADPAAALSMSTITIREGTRLALFTVSTTEVPKSTVADISASLGGMTEKASLTVTPRG
jgi:hypothetical protein